MAALGVIALAVGALAAVVWRGVDQFAAQETDRQREMKHFHAGLLNELGSLAEKSGMLTSADLCPVRFRLRFPNGITSPLNRVDACLSVATPDGISIVQGGRNGTVDFGLMPPKRYQLPLSLADTYTLRHDFEVLPGVPIDRLVLCPHSSPADLAVTIEIVWPEGVDDAQMLAVCEVERDSITVGEWTWRPEEELPLRLVAATWTGDSADQELMWAIDELEPADAEIVRSVSHRYCRLRGISVYRCGPEARAALERTARCVFGDSGEDGAILCAGPAPGFRWDGGGLNPVWRIPAPDGLVAEVRRAANGDAVNMRSSTHALERPAAATARCRPVDRTAEWDSPSRRIVQPAALRTTRRTTENGMFTLEPQITNLPGVDAAQDPSDADERRRAGDRSGSVRPAGDGVCADAGVREQRGSGRVVAGLSSLTSTTPSPATRFPLRAPHSPVGCRRACARLRH